MSPPTDSDDDSNASPPREPPPVSPVLLPPVHVLRLPTRWSDQVKHSSLSVTADGRDLSYNGSACTGERDAAAARTSHPIPPACGIYYYEIEILSKGQKGHISVGLFAGRDVKLNRLPGCEMNSWGYHSDSGCSFAAEKNGTPYGPTYVGDIIGCGIDFTSHKAFFTKNGTLLGNAFEGIGKDIELYPSVGLQHNGELIRVNFGHEPFKFDIDYHVQQQRNSTWRKILSTPLDVTLLLDGPQKHNNEDRDDSKGKHTPQSSISEAQTRSMMNKLVLSYLIHHGYAKTAQALQRQEMLLKMKLPQPSKPVTKSGDQDMDMDANGSTEETSLSTAIERRTRIVNAVVAGDIDLAISETEKYHPIVFETEAGLMLFKLRCRKFVELVLEASELKKRLRTSQSKPSVDDDVMEMSMDVDDDITIARHSDNAMGTNGFVSSTTYSTWPEKGKESATTLVEQALSRAIAYGQVLANDYKADTRSEVRQLFKRTFAIVAWDDPREAGGLVAEVVSLEARINLANELNQTILRSQGHPTRPALETLCRHTATCVTQLGLLGVGAAAFADMSRELFSET
ncbi:hypothetical protein AMATHDRAFT_134637 [Amanita thiersii Skay4041]|uniref:B30.2/SPRY domain-containing protein n=1 Tax=Amanita thiersii Skay4041 TaxID=703135 RepID=A0A2A9NWX8_9AGAR|nr:hypothetical protein AMATHDRAFT_134637 [Amanita thiersii Skay4041]